MMRNTLKQNGMKRKGKQVRDGTSRSEVADCTSSQQVG